VSVITSIGLDHMEILGDTIEAIAREKAGIVKPGVPVVENVVQTSARETIRRIAEERPRVERRRVDLGRVDAAARSSDRELALELVDA